MNQATALLGLITETSLHAGAGSSVGVVDLPIQREGHNGWPCVFGSAVKGALRDRGETVLTAGSPDLLAVFGPDTKNASDNAGALMVGDARLLLLPVRSLTTAFKWVTCPEAMKRLKRDADRLGLLSKLGLDNLQVTGAGGSSTSFTLDQLAVSGMQALAAEGTGDVFLEEYRFTQSTEPMVDGLIPALAKLVKRDDAEGELKKRLLIVSDDMFAHLTNAATPVNAHIALKSDSKTVVGGALWYEETLPPETVLYVPLVAAASRKVSHKLDAASVLGKVTGFFNEKPWLQLGGNETVGMGWCAVSVLSA